VSFLSRNFRAWLEVFWWVAITVHGVRRVLSGDTRKPYLAGFLAVFVSIALTSNGETDVFVAKINPYGNWSWAVRADGTVPFQRQKGC